MPIYSIRTIPVTSWSSTKPYNLRPKPQTLLLLNVGLFIFGAGETLLIAAGIGVSPWTVLAQGFCVTTGLSIGGATLVVSIAVLAFWVPLGQCPGVGTILNVIIISVTIEFLLLAIPTFEDTFHNILCVFLGTLLVGIGSGIYLVANLGPGPRDGLMTGLQKITGQPIAWVRAYIEISVTLCGWLLGGNVGIGTVIFALGIGHAISAGLMLTAYLSDAIHTKDDIESQ